MKRSRTLIPILLALVAAPASAGDAASVKKRTPVVEDCPTVDPMGYVRFENFPAEEKNLRQATYLDDANQLQSADEGIDHIARLVVSSHRSECAPIIIVNVIGAADFDSRGTSFEDHVSVERAFSAMKEIKKVVEAARLGAVQREEIPDTKVGFTFGGIGTRGAINKKPANELERAENRSVTVHFAHGPVRAPASELAVPSESVPDATSPDDVTPPEESPGEE